MPLGKLGAYFLDKDRALDHGFSMHALGVALGSIFKDLGWSREAPELKKQCKFVVLSG